MHHVKFCGADNEPWGDYQMDALSEDVKSLAIAVLNPFDSEQSIRTATNGAKLASAGKRWRRAPDSIDATVQVDNRPEVQVEKLSLGAFSGTITVRPF